MLYNPTGNNLALVPKTSPKVREICKRKALAGADYWRANSVIDTGYNAAHVQVEDGEGTDGQIQEVIHCTGYYAKWREIGSSRAGPRAPEWTLRRSIPAIQGA
jgi:hypothetical protein